MTEYDAGYSAATADMKTALLNELPAFIDHLDTVGDVDAAYHEFVKQVEEAACHIDTDPYSNIRQVPKPSFDHSTIGDE